MNLKYSVRHEIYNSVQKSLELMSVEKATKLISGKLHNNLWDNLGKILLNYNITLDDIR